MTIRTRTLKMSSLSGIDGPLKWIWATSIARELDQNISEMSLGERGHFERAGFRLTECHCR